MNYVKLFFYQLFFKIKNYAYYVTSQIKLVQLDVMLYPFT